MYIPAIPQQNKVVFHKSVHVQICEELSPHLLQYAVMVTVSMCMYMYV